MKSVLVGILSVASALIITRILLPVVLGWVQITFGWLAVFMFVILLCLILILIAWKI